MHVIGNTVKIYISLKITEKIKPLKEQITNIKTFFNKHPEKLQFTGLSM